MATWDCSNTEGSLLCSTQSMHFLKGNLRVCLHERWLCFYFDLSLGLATLDWETPDDLGWILGVQGSVLIPGDC